MGKNIGKSVSKSLSCKYIKLMDLPKQSSSVAFKTTSKSVIFKKAEATSDLICNKIAHKITKVLRMSPQRKFQVKQKIKNLTVIYQKKDIYPYKKSKLLMS